MKKLERIHYCEVCDEGISYTGEDRELWKELTASFAKRHTHQEPAERRAN